jgi:Skp family chaperone for outer membrane proteins
MSERPTPETDSQIKTFTSISKLKRRFEASTGKVSAEFARRLERERDEAREELHDIRLNLGEDADGYTLLHAVCVLQNERNEAMEDSLEQARLLGMGSEREAKLISDLEFRRGLYKVQEQYLETARRERDEAREAFSSIHRWIERNHADGFIDSLTYLQNLERVTDCWYDRIDKIERERDEARERLAKITIAAEAVIDRWEQPAWKDTEPTATVIYRLRDALGREAE